jgi:hypothetical protein
MHNCPDTTHSVAAPSWFSRGGYVRPSRCCPRCMHKWAIHLARVHGFRFEWSMRGRIAMVKCICSSGLHGHAPGACEREGLAPDMLCPKCNVEEAKKRLNDLLSFILLEGSLRTPPLPSLRSYFDHLRLLMLQCRIRLRYVIRLRVNGAALKRSVRTSCRSTSPLKNWS